MPTLADIFAQAVQHYQAGNLRQAEQLFLQVVQVDPQQAEALSYLGLIAHQMGRIQEAVARGRQVVWLRPDAPEAHNNLGNVLRGLGLLEEAITVCRQALQLRPNFPAAQVNLGSALAQLGQTAEAVEVLRKAVRLDPRLAEGWTSLGNALALQDQPGEAIPCFQQAIRLNPADANAQANLGETLVQQSRLDEGEACLEKALQINAGHPQAHFNRALLWLLEGKWEKGWSEYEWRFQTPKFPRYSFQQPRWDGSAATQPGQSILLLAEQGLGDTLLFVRYAPMVQNRGWRVIVQCQPALLKLLATAKGIDCLLPHGSSLPPFDTYAPFFSLPGIFRNTVDDVPANVPYLHADDKLDNGGKCEVRSAKSAPPSTPHSALRTPHAFPHFFVGIAWQGNTDYVYDRQRSAPLRHFHMLAQVEGVQLLSLQKGPGAEQLEDNQALKSSICRLPSTFDEASGAFMDTAAIMRHLDLVITTDTAIAHLAGSLGVPVWVALPRVPDWRWLLQREDSPWYPTMRLFRQTRRGEWREVFERMAWDLKEIISRRNF
jgi:tetratricopeptide (TPR) repeat protein